ncbi:hypothetical protein T439DRAFT_83517 [Meredithblackwellia eburnea MCA 4105]
MKPEHSNGPPAKKRKASQAGIEVEAAQAKTRACHNCRRAKLRCVIQADGEPCRRCAVRGDECRFKIPLHDEKWQEATTQRIDSLHTSVSYILKSLEAISRHLDIPFEPPQLLDAPSPPTTTSPSVALLRAQRRTSSTAETVGELPFATLSQSPEEQQVMFSRRIGSLSSSHHQYNYLTRTGAEELLAQGSVQPLVTPPFPLISDPSCSPGTGAPVSLLAPLGSPGEIKSGSSSFFGLLDDFDRSSDTSSRHSAKSSTAPAATTFPSAHEVPLTPVPPLVVVGSEDPRADVVKNGLVPQQDADILIDFFHAHLAHHLFGFPFRIGSWPFLPGGDKSSVTPLILGSICLISSERIPRYHDLLHRLVNSDLRENILDVEAHTAFVPNSESAQGEPDLDLEQGIGPEEIGALLIYATLSCSTRSDVIARAAFDITRGYLKTFMLPQPPPVTFGEVLGLLPARRDLTFENWLRLWLFSYIVNVQQSLHHERPTPIFDPQYFCETLLCQQATTTDEQADRELVAHARLCALLQRAQHVRLTPSWKSSPKNTIIASYDQWNLDLDRWWTTQEFEYPSQSAIFSLTLFKLFSKTYLNLAASKEHQLVDSGCANRWRFRVLSVRAAFDMVRFVQDEPAVGCVNILAPFYIKMVTLAAVVLLDTFQYATFVMMPCSPEHASEMISRLATHLDQSPTPSGHTSHVAAGTLRRAVAKMERQGISPPTAR